MNCLIKDCNFDDVAGRFCLKCKYNNKCESAKNVELIVNLMKDHDIITNSKNIRKAMKETINMSYEEMKEYFIN